ncbi:MAG: hypothetical protein ACI9NN_002295 [Bacteroidia bacterium]|jgi:hypothetical protein
MKKHTFPLALIVLVFGLAGCLTDKGELTEEVSQGYCDTLQATYIDTMKVLIDTKCATQGCHSVQSSLGDFTTYANMQAAGALSESQIGARVSATNVSFVMPPGNPLPDSLKQVFECWVNSGFPQQ